MVATVAAASRCVNSRRRCSSQSAISRRSGSVNASSMVKTLPVTLTGPQRWHFTAASREPALAVAVREDGAAEQRKAGKRNHNRHRRARPKRDEREPEEKRDAEGDDEHGRQQSAPVPKWVPAPHTSAADQSSPPGPGGAGVVTCPPGHPREGANCSRRRGPGGYLEERGRSTCSLRRRSCPR